jgi:hyperosmotically inducible protein
MKENEMTKTGRVWLSAGALALGISLGAPAFAAETSDPWLTTKVKASLLTADGVDGLKINVDTTDGRVTLHGKAATSAEKAQAEKLAKSVQGVKEVRNLIEVVPSSVAKAVTAKDEDIEKRVKMALAGDETLAGSSITVQSVNDGAVLLDGTAESLSAHLRALETARAVDGVRRVESQIQSPDRLADEEIWHDAPKNKAESTTTKVTSAASDAWLTSATKVRLMAADVSAFDVNVDTRGGVVTLFGAVPTAAQKATAEAEAKKVDGVKTVKNELQVVPAVAAAAVEKKDEQIQTAVTERLGEKTGLKDVDVEVKNGVVRLTGSVGSQSDRLAALTTARTSEGVRSVIGDELRVERN